MAVVVPWLSSSTGVQPGSVSPVNQGDFAPRSPLSGTSAVPAPNPGSPSAIEGYIQTAVGAITAGTVAKPTPTLVTPSSLNAEAAQAVSSATATSTQSAQTPDTSAVAGTPGTPENQLVDALAGLFGPGASSGGGLAPFMAPVDTTPAPQDTGTSGGPNVGLIVIVGAVAVGGFLWWRHHKKAA